MFALFRPRARLIRGIVEPGKTDYIRRIYTDRLTFLRRYYKERVFYLKNNHILVRLLTTGLGSLHPDYETFMWTAVDRADTLSRHFQFTSSVSYGKIWYGDFYGEGSYEIIIGDNEMFDVPSAVDNWENLTPVRVLTHSISDLGMAIPNGKTNHYVDGLAVIYINIPLLMFQYRMFIESQIRKANSKENAIFSPKLFLYKYVLPGMMVSHIDHVLVNRLINLKMGMPMTEMLVKSPFFQAEAGNHEGSGIINDINEAQETVLEKITRSQVTYDQALANIFTVTEKDALDLLIMPDIAPTRQVWWSFILARLKHIKFLLRVGKDNISGHDQMYKNRVIIDLSRLLDSHVLERMLTAELLESTISEINETLELAKN